MKSIRRGILFGAAMAAAVVLTGGPASANVGLSQSFSMPSAVAVGQTVNGTFTVINTNTVPNQGESNTVSSLRLAPSCGGPGVPANPCSTPDPGVFAVNTPATGAAGTACAGVLFTVSAPDANGIVTFVPNSPVVLAPPGGLPGSDRCTVNFTFRVLKVPTIDSNPGQPGVQTRANFNSQVVGQISNLMPSTTSSVEITVTRAAPTIVTQASPSVAVGGTISDAATITGVAGVPAPTGTVTFQVYGPNDATCSGPVFAASTNGLIPASSTSATATSGAFPVNQAGTYRFVASYSGDANYVAVTAFCNAPNETVNVTTFVNDAVNDFDADGRTDIGVFRPSTGGWFVSRSGGGNTVQTWGVSTDILTPGDFDGDGRADIAVYRPSTGQWFISRSTGGSIVTTWGVSTDVPVVGDYDGDGRDDIAVYRPSTGQWFINRSTGGSLVVVWGGAGDVPL